MQSRWLHVDTNAGQPVQIGRTKIITFARVVRFEFPGAMGGLIWNRPLSLLVKKEDGSESVLDIPDVTRQAQLALLAFGLLGGILISFVLSFIRKRKRHNLSKN
ncbi:MAG TPA: hypothetical protein VJL34_11225 [Anaerolineales bacterium]|nr:hypothetical protein [Anaerolineales bacterium]